MAYHEGWRPKLRHSPRVANHYEARDAVDTIEIREHRCGHQAVAAAATCSATFSWQSLQGN